MFLDAFTYLTLLMAVRCDQNDSNSANTTLSPITSSEAPIDRTQEKIKAFEEYGRKMKPFLELLDAAQREKPSEAKTAALAKVVQVMAMGMGIGRNNRSFEIEERKAIFELSEVIDAPRREAALREANRIKNLPTYLQLDLAYEQNVSVRMKQLMPTLELYKKDVSNVKALNEFTEECRNVSNIVEFLRLFKGWDCMNTTLSTTAAWTLFEIIDQIKFTNYWLSNEDETKFKTYFAALYFYLADRDMDFYSDKIQKFISTEKTYQLKRIQGFLYENKLALLMQLVKHLGIDMRKASMSECLPMTAFVQSHFSRTVLLEERNAIAQQIRILKNVSHECAKVSPSKDTNGAESVLSNIENMTAWFEPFLSTWSESLLESTWPEVETQLVRSLIKESSQGRHIYKISVEYERIVEIVLDKMTLVGNPRYVRQYIITKDPMERHPSKDFENQCKWYSCSRRTTSDIQFVILRTENNKTIINKKKRNLKDFVKSVTPTVLDAMEKKYYNDKYLPNVLQRLSIEEGVNLRNFANHSSFIGMRSNRYTSNCTVFYAVKAEGELGTDSIQKIHYHNDGGLFSYCNDWVYLLGV